MDLKRKTVCQSCEAPEPNNLHLCEPCTKAFQADLLAAPDLMRSMFTTMSKQAVLGHSGGKGKNDAQPLPLNMNAQRRRHELQSVLINLGLRISHITNQVPPGRDIEKLAPWIRSHLPTLRKHPEAGHWRNETATAVSNARYAIDTPQERLSIGKCGAETDEGDCPKEVLARKGQAFVTCPACGSVWDVKERQRWAISEAWDAIAYPPEIVRALQKYDPESEVTMKRFQNWVQMGVLEFAAVDDKGRKMYRIKDVQDTAKEPWRRATA